MNILEKKQFIEKVNECLDLEEWTENMMDSFILGYRLGKKEVE